MAHWKKDYAAEHAFHRQTLPLAREIGAQQDIAHGLIMQGQDEIELGDSSPDDRGGAVQGRLVGLGEDGGGVGAGVMVMAKAAGLIPMAL